MDHIFQQVDVDFHPVIKKLIAVTIGYLRDIAFTVSATLAENFSTVQPPAAPPVYVSSDLITRPVI